MTCSTSGNVYTATFSANPGLMSVGQGVTVSPPGYSDNYGNDAIYVVQESAGNYIAYALSCTHQGCQVNKSGTSWRCPCHGATFSATGQHTGGPGSGNLQSYSVCADSTGVTITLQ
jgi:Rieske Fe-S protein